MKTAKLELLLAKQDALIYDLRKAIPRLSSASLSRSARYAGAASCCTMRRCARGSSLTLSPSPMRCV